VLNNLGFSDKEIKLYKILVQRGVSTPSALSMYSEFSRSMCYTYLTGLQQKGLISETVMNGGKAFMVEDPRKIISLIENQEKNLKLHKKLASNAISKLGNIQKDRILKPSIKYYKGLEGIKKIYNQTLNNYEGEIRIFFGGYFYPDDLKDFIMTEYIPSRVEKNISCKVLTNSDVIGDRDSAEIRSRRQIESSIQPNVEINIFDDKINFVSFFDNQYTGIQIQHQEIVSSLKEIFDLLWDKSDLPTE
jgi:sugar-specific transcriptional regulator TrmB